MSTGSTSFRPVAVAACPAGYRDAACDACGSALYIPGTPGTCTGDVLCEGCRRVGQALADADDTDPEPPAAGAIDPELLAEYEAETARLTDDDLITAIEIVDAGRDRNWFLTATDRAAWLGLATSQVLARLAGRRAAA
jgi:hypothetical protein